MGQIIRLSTMQPVVIPHAVVGQLVKYSGDMANRDGIGAVLAVHDDQWGRRYDVGLVDGREWRRSMLDGPRWHVSADVANAEQLAIIRAGVAAKKATDEAAKTSAASEFERIKAEIKAANPHLIQQDKGGDLTQAAKNIRIELKRAFPGVKFAVRTERYAGGDSIDVIWTDGPNSEQVEKIAKKYSGGHFDGMTDSYEYSRSPWVEVFGSSKYVFTRRDYSDKMLQSVMRRVCERFGGVEVPTVEDYRQGRTHGLMNSGGCDMGREINSALHRHTYCIAKA